jgi:hypothetical protein
MEKQKVIIETNLKIPGLEGEIIERAADDYDTGDYVSRDGTDIHYVEEGNSRASLITAVCIIPPAADWIKAGEVERNIPQRYCRINKHMVQIAKREYEKLKLQFPNGFKE